MGAPIPKIRQMIAVGSGVLKSTGGLAVSGNLDDIYPFIYPPELEHLNNPFSDRDKIIADKDEVEKYLSGQISKMPERSYDD